MSVAPTSASLSSAATILKNIFEFVKILNSASQQSVELWDDLSLMNALDWADYCQEVRLVICIWKRLRPGAVFFFLSVSVPLLLLL